MKPSTLTAVKWFLMAAILIAASVSGFAVTLSTTNDLEFTLTSTGVIDDTTYDTTDISGGNTGGFYYCTDVSSTGSYTLFTGSIDSITGGYSFSSTISNDLSVYAEYEEMGTYISVEGEIKDTSGEDRGVWLMFKLPLGANGWTWWDSVNHTRSVPGDETDGPTRSYLYPLPTAAGSLTGVSMCIPPTAPIVFWSSCDDDGLMLKFGVGLTPDTDKFPSKAAFSFRIYPVAKDWGFRESLENYYTWFSDYYELPNWMLEKLDNFHMWHHGGNYDDAKDYMDLTSHMAYFNLKGSARGINVAKAFQSESKLQAEIDACTDFIWYDDYTEGRNVFYSSRLFNSNGETLLIPLAEEEEEEEEDPPDSILYPLNMDMDLYTDENPVPDTHGKHFYDLATGVLAQTEPHDFEALHFDTVGSWAKHLNFRSEHFGYADYPCSFDNNGDVITYNYWGKVEYFKALSDWSDTEGDTYIEGSGMKVYAVKEDYGLLADFKNHGRWFIAPHLDSSWHEGNFKTEFGDLDRADGQSGYDQERTIMGRKSYRISSGNLAVRAELPTVDKIKTALSQNTAYGLAVPICYYYFIEDSSEPQYLPDYSKYTRDKALWDDYLPINNTMRLARWQPIIHATHNKSQIEIVVERFGSSPPYYFSVWGPDSPPTPVTVTIDLDALNISTANVSYAEMISHANISGEISGTDLIVTVPMESLMTRVIRVGNEGGGLNHCPEFTTNPWVETEATALYAYSSSIADNVTDADSDSLTFSKLVTKVSPAGWLNVASNGALSGTPTMADAGTSRTWTVRAEDAYGGLDQATIYINVVAPETDDTTFYPSDDAYVRDDEPDSNYGSADSLLIKAYETGGNAFDSYLKFTVSGISETIVQTKLRIYSNENPKNIHIHPVTNITWTEGTVTWNNKPDMGSALDNIGQAYVGWVEFEVSSHVTGNGTYSFGLKTDTSANYSFSSKEGTYDPELVVSVLAVEDTTPPANPTGLGATPGDGLVSLDWNDNTEGDLDGYNVYRTTTSGSGYSKVNGSLVSASAYTDSTVTNNTTYYYVVSAVDTSTNESGYSSEVSAYPQQGGDTTPPANPTGLGATPGDEQVALDWNDNTEGDLDGYNVYRSTTTGSGYSKINGSLVSASAYTDSTVTNDTTYYYVVTAVDTSTNESGYSSEASTMPEGGTTSNFNPSDDAYVRDDNPSNNYGSAITLNIKTGDNTWYSYLKFNVSGISGTVSSAVLKVYSNENAEQVHARAVSDTSWTEGAVTWNNKPALGSSLDYIETGAIGWMVWDVTSHITGNGTFSLGMTTDKPVNYNFDSKEGSKDPVLSVTYGGGGGDTTPPANPTGLGATPGDGQVALDWNDNTEGDLDGYNVYRSTTTGSGYSKVNGSLVSASAYTDSSVSNVTTYYYVVTAVDTSSNESGYSSEVSAYPDSIDIYVYDINMGGYESKTGYYTATATVWIKDENTNNLDGATVYGSWSGATVKGDGSGATAGGGTVTLESDAVKGGGTYTFTVTNVTATGYTYNSSLNNEDYDSVTLP